MIHTLLSLKAKEPQNQVRPCVMANAYNETRIIELIALMTIAYFQRTDVMRRDNIPTLEELKGQVRLTTYTQSLNRPEYVSQDVLTQANLPTGYRQHVQTVSDAIDVKLRNSFHPSVNVIDNPEYLVIEYKGDHVKVLHRYDGYDDEIVAFKLTS